jgi:citrate lyase synthetase
MLLQGDVERLHLFREEVLYGDITKEVELHIHEHQEKAFQMCQFAAQYVDNCVAILENRSDKYTSQLSKLQQQKRNLLLEKKKKV